MICKKMYIYKKLIYTPKGVYIYLKLVRHVYQRYIYKLPHI